MVGGFLVNLLLLPGPSTQSPRSCQFSPDLIHVDWPPPERLGWALVKRTSLKMPSQDIQSRPLGDTEPTAAAAAALAVEGSRS